MYVIMYFKDSRRDFLRDSDGELEFSLAWGQQRPKLGAKNRSNIIIPLLLYVHFNRNPSVHLILNYLTGKRSNAWRQLKW